MKLTPGTKKHDKLLTALLSFQRESISTVESKRSEWRELERYTSLYTRQKAATNTSHVSSQNMQDTGVAVSCIGDDRNNNVEEVVVPVSLSVLDTFLTYMSSAFFGDKFVRFEGMSTKDAYGALVLEKLVERNNKSFGNELALYVAWRNALVYGVGPTVSVWERKFAIRSETTPIEVDTGDTVYDFGNVVDHTKKQRVLMDEGVRFVPISPWNYLPSPVTPPERIQDAPAVGWFEITTYYALLNLRRSADDTETEDIFNLDYLRYVPNDEVANATYGINNSSIYSITNSDLDINKTDAETWRNKYNPDVCVAWICMEVIPKIFGIGKSNTPEKWIFGVANDKVIIKAEPLTYTNNLYPIAVATTEIDGVSALPMARILYSLSMQKMIDFNFKSYILQVKKNINGNWIVDPSVININDLQTTTPGKLIRVRERGWGRTDLNKSITQLNGTDNSSEAFSQVAFLRNLASDMTGAADSVQGIISARTSRISAQEASNAQSAAMSKLTKMANLMARTLHVPLAELTCSLIQNVMDDSMFIDIGGDLARSMSDEFGIYATDGQFREVVPSDLYVSYRVNPTSGVIPEQQNISTWMELLQLSANSPVLAGKINIEKIVSYVARILGVNNWKDFVIMNDQQVAGGVSNGTLNPLPQAPIA